jgi:hypothetical protein
MATVTLHELLGEIAMEIAGFEVYVERSLETLLAVEEVVGAAAPFGRRLEAGNVSPHVLAALYCKLTRLIPRAPTHQQIENWIAEVGTAHPRLGVWITALAFGADRIERAGRAESSSATAESFRSVGTQSALGATPIGANDV